MGAGTAIPSIRNLSETIIRYCENSNLIRINPRESFGPKNTISVSKGSLESLKEII
jgi:hypothetical protein